MDTDDVISDGTSENVAVIQVKAHWLSCVPN